MALNVTITYPQQEEMSDFYVLLHDYETELYKMPRSFVLDGLDDYKGYPEMIPFVNRKGVPLTKDVLWFIFDLCLISQYNFTYKSAGWQRLTNEQKRKAANQFETAYDSGRFITNNTGIDQNYNPIGEEILGQPHREGLAKMWEVACGGNIVKARSHTPVSKIATDVDGNKRSVECLDVEVWDGKSPAPNALTFNWVTHPHLVHWATNSTPFGYDGQLTRVGPWRVDLFPFFNGLPYPMLFTSPNYVPLHRVRRLKKTELIGRSTYRP